MQALVAVVMGSKSDWPTMEAAAEIMDKLQVPYHVEVVSAHRTPDKLMEFAAGAADRGFFPAPWLPGRQRGRLAAR